jgi:DNA mismatch repair protein MutL
MYLEKEDLPFVLSDIAGRLQSCRGAENELLEELLKSVACKAAVKAGMVTDNAELQIFAQSVLENDSLRNCPHGRPCVTFVSRYQLEKLFKRIV